MDGAISSLESIMNISSFYTKLKSEYMSVLTAGIDMHKATQGWGGSVTLAVYIEKYNIGYNP